MIFLRCKFVAYHTNSEQIVLWHQHLIAGWRNGQLTLSAPHYRMSHPGSQYQACTASTRTPEFVQVMRIKELQGNKSLENLRLGSQQLLSIKTGLTQLLRLIKIIRIIFGLVLPTLHASRKYFCFHFRGRMRKLWFKRSIEELSSDWSFIRTNYPGVSSISSRDF